MLRPSGVASAALVVLLLVCAPAWAAGDLWVRFISVGQGDSALIVAPSGKTVLIDAGPNGAWDEILAEVRDAGVSRIDTVILTHAHADHISGLRKVMDSVEVGEVYEPGEAASSSTFLETLEKCEAASIPVHTARVGQTIDLGDGVTMDLLAPDEPLLSGTRSDLNSNSVVAMLRYGEVAVLFTGDAEIETEQRLRGLGVDLSSTILKVPHHGSRHSSSKSFLEAAHPFVGVVSCGLDNRYGHPHAQAIDRLSRTSVVTYRTDLQGTLLLRSDGKSWAFGTTRDRPGDPNWPQPVPRARPSAGALPDTAPAQERGVILSGRSLCCASNTRRKTRPAMPMQPSAVEAASMNITTIW